MNWFLFLGRGFVDGAKDIVPPPPDASPRIKLRGSIPPLSIALAASVAVDDNHRNFEWLLNDSFL